MDVASAIAVPNPPPNTSQVWLDALLSLFYPAVCQICGTEHARREEGYVGTHCQEAVEWVENPACMRCGLPFAGEITGEFACERCQQATWHFDRAQAAVVARGVAMEMIHRYKYERAIWFEPALAGWLTRRVAAWLKDRVVDAIVPVPLHPVKAREREFNQAARLAAKLGQAVGLPSRPEWLRRIKFTDTQTRLTRPQREDNMRQAFAVPPGVRLAGLKLILVDDVFTTGATVNSAAGALRAAGADTVSVWTVGRAVR